MATSSVVSSYIHSDAGDRAPTLLLHPRRQPMHTLNLETLSAPFRELYTPQQARAAASRLILKFGEDGGPEDDPDRDSRRLLIAILSFIAEDRS